MKNHIKAFILVCLWTITTASFAGTIEWKQNPVVYGISPYYFAKDRTIKALPEIQKRLPEIKELGANVIWLMPVTTPAEPGQGYNVVDYENVWSELGTKKDLKNLVSRAHDLDIKVLLDVVLNHSSTDHPFIQKACDDKENHYNEFYQSKPITEAPYARHFNSTQLLECPLRSFIYYFWPYLVNFNYESPRLREYLIGNLVHWIKEYDVDGFRFDASWGPSSRWPQFYEVVSSKLKSVKSDIALLAEDKAGYPAEYEGSDHPHLSGSQFDWAYDWNNQDKDWMSKWSFEIDEDKTVFNEENPEVAAKMFMQALSYTENVKDVKVLRYLENNDTPGFLRHHTLKEAQFAAEAMFLLPGVPLIFYGQEVGNRHEQWHLRSFDPQRSIRSYNPKLHSFYKELIDMRRSSKTLSEGALQNLKRIGPTRVSFERVYGDEQIYIELDFKKKTISRQRVVKDGRAG